MAIANRVEAAADDDEWKLIADMVKKSSGKKSPIKDNGKKVLGVADKLPKNNPTVHEIEVDGTRYAIVRIITLG